MENRLYQIWTNMRQRCLNPKRKDYKYYGGRGISIDDEWETFSGFERDMLAAYEAGLSLDRTDVDGNYCKENCRWVPWEEQARNKRVYCNSPVGVSGVTKFGDRWRARAHFKGKAYSLGVYSEVADAIKAVEKFWENFEEGQ